MLKFTAQSDGQWCDEMLENTKLIIDHDCEHNMVDRVVLVWDADNYGANPILDRIIPGVATYVKHTKTDIKIYYAMGTFREKTGQGNGWNLEPGTWCYDQYPDPRTDTTTVTDDFRTPGVWNHNGWLGSHHLQQRKTQFNLSWCEIYVIVLGKQQSWPTERLFLGTNVKAWIHSDRYVGQVSCPCGWG